MKLSTGRAKIVDKKLGFCLVFGTLCKENPDTLRSYYNKAMNQAKSLDFQDELKKILR